MTEHDTPDPVISARLPLDEHSGPASRVTSRQAAKLIEDALDQWQPAQARVDHAGVAARGSLWLNARTWALAASALLAFTLGARAFYVWMQAPTQEETAPSTRSAAPIDTTSEAQRAAPIVHVTPIAASDVETRRESRNVERDEDWMLRANRLRGEGRYAEAVAAYQRVIRKNDPGPTYVARVAAGSLLLEQLDEASAARRMFVAAQAQQPQGALALEITRGIAEAARRMSDRDAEIDALRTLVTRFPQARAADSARERLKALHATP